VKKWRCLHDYSWLENWTTSCFSNYRRFELFFLSRSEWNLFIYARHFLTSHEKTKNKKSFFKLESSSNIRNAAAKDNKDLIETTKRQIRMQQRNEIEVDKFDRDNKLIVRISRDSRYFNTFLVRDVSILFDAIRLTLARVSEIRTYVSSKLFEQQFYMRFSRKFDLSFIRQTVTRCFALFRQ
jgi:hypothetical protein